MKSQPLDGSTGVTGVTGVTGSSSFFSGMIVGSTIMSLLIGAILAESIWRIKVKIGKMRVTA